MIKSKKQHIGKEANNEATSCVNTNAKNLWIIGIAAIALTTLFCFAIFRTNNNYTMPAADTAQSVMAFPAGQQAALANPNCFTCPSFNQCFPQGTSQGGQLAALPGANCFTCPSFNQCFPQGTGTQPAQQAAFSNPNSFNYPNFNQQFPQGPGMGQQGPFFQGPNMTNCPICKFSFNDPLSANRGFAWCPRCKASIPFRSNGNFTNVALTNTVNSAPPIFRDALMPHKFRGVCENCHIVKPDIAIPATAQMPHEYRGVCSNCHKILGTKAGAQ
ncbi:MAG: magnetochrome domain-containing protein [Candidatus Omnitrophica bacterium]|nr:magnetochrome domain-containing protein [Candidatus Omnitrophota bacterium]